MKMNDLEAEFFFYVKLAGIKQTKPGKFEFENNSFNVHAFCNANAAKAMGGKRRAYKLLRHAKFIEHVASQRSGSHVMGTIGGSFNALSQKYPILRSYYESAKIGGFHHTWYRES